MVILRVVRGDKLNMEMEMEVSGQLHASAALSTRGCRPGTYWLGDWLDPRVGLDSEEKRKILLLSGIEPWSHIMKHCLGTPG
jgi:hypothetical protein